MPSTRLWIELESSCHWVGRVASKHIQTCKLRNQLNIRENSQKNRKFRPQKRESSLQFGRNSAKMVEKSRKCSNFAEILPKCFRRNSPIFAKFGEIWRKNRAFSSRFLFFREYWSTFEEIRLLSCIFIYTRIHHPAPPVRAAEIVTYPMLPSRVGAF